ncbi:MAG: helix-turn-helix domain-containing protein [Anaeromyxobacter sp.]
MNNAAQTTAIPEALLTAKEVAGLLKASESMVYKLQREGRLPAVRIGWLLRFHPDTVRAFMRGEPLPPRLVRSK